MVPIAWRFLLKDKLRLAISVCGVALSIMLVLLLGGFLTGMSRQITAYVDNTPADYYVGQTGVANLLGAGSVIPWETLRKVEAAGLTIYTATLAKIREYGVLKALLPAASSETNYRTVRHVAPAFIGRIVCSAAARSDDPSPATG